MSTIFISYRRAETAGEARALATSLAACLSEHSVFMDVDSITLGRDFRRALQERLVSCDLMLVLIGKNWVTSKDQSGQRRLENVNDFIRLEIETALQRNISVTPVLLQGAQMPTPEQLPKSMRDFAYRSAFELSHTRWESDVHEMLRRLKIMESRATANGTTTDSRSTIRTPTKKVVFGSIVVVLVLVTAIGVMRSIQKPSPTSPAPAPSLQTDSAKAAALFEKGEQYYYGRGVEQNYAKAAEWYRKAADQGVADAQARLGVMYAYGQGVPNNDTEAVKWYRKAADQGDADAQTRLGCMYENGRGVPKDDAEAVKWFRKAADQGDALGQANLGLMYVDGRGVPKDYAEAVKWFRKAADQGDALGQVELGLMYVDGRGVRKDYAEAVKWFRKAADQGDALGQVELGLMYAYGQGVPKDDAEAVKWYRKAAQQGNNYAQGELRKRQVSW